MADQKRRLSLQEINRQRQRSAFVGREAQLKLFRENLVLSPENEQRRFIFAVSGQGGVGKSSLLRHFRRIADDDSAVSAFTDHAEADVIGVMAQVAAQFAEQGHRLEAFESRHKAYQQLKQRLEADPDAPQGLSALVGQSLAKGGMRLARLVPGADLALGLLDEEAVAKQAGDWASFVRRKIGNKDEVQLVQEPVAVLTPLFLDGLNEVADQRQVALFFDTYERTYDFLEPWLIEILDERHGGLSPNIVLTIAGRDELDSNRWTPFDGLITRCSLEPLDEPDARAFLVRQGVTNEAVIEFILRLSGRLPLLLAMLAKETPSDPAQLGDPTDTAVDRFLLWVDDPRQRQAAIDAALPRVFNRDVLAVIVGATEVDALFDWLIRMPFVLERSNGWAYHEVVRSHMLRFKRRESPRGWETLHQSLASYYKERRDSLGFEAKQGKKNAVWQRHWLEEQYHLLGQYFPQAEPRALGAFLEAWEAQTSFATQWAAMMRAAGEDFQLAAVSRWGERLGQCQEWYANDSYAELAAAFKTITATSGLLAEHRALGHAWCGELARLQSSYKEALADFDAALKLNPEHAWTLAHRGETYQRLKRYEEALADLDAALKLNSEYAWALGSRGWVYQTLERYEEALADFDVVLKLNPEDTWTLRQRGWTYRQLKRYEEALVDFDAALKLNSENTWALGSRGQVFRALGRYEEALADFDAALKLNPEDTWTLRQRGQVFRALKRYEEALADFDAALKLDPEYAWALGNRGEVYQALERYEEALADFDAALNLNPEDIWGFRQRGWTYWRLNRYEEALADFDVVLNLNPEEIWALQQRGWTYGELRRYEEALADFDAILKLNPEDIWTLRQRGQTYWRLRRSEEALADFNTALKLNPDDSWSLGRRGEISLALKRYEEALSSFDQALNLNADSDWKLHFRSIAHRLLGNEAAAAHDLARAIQLGEDGHASDPMKWTTLFNLALYHLAAGHEEQARRYYEEGLSGNCPSRYLQMAIEDLDDYLALFPGEAAALAMRELVHDFLARSGR